MFDVFIDEIRNNLIKSVFNNNIHTFLPTFVSKNNIKFPVIKGKTHHLPFDKDTLINYYYLIRLCEIYGITKSKVVRPKENNMMVDETSNLSSKIQDTLVPIAVVLYYSDLKRVHLFLALIAWLTIDEFRWHKQVGYSQVPEDLSYGLILQYPDFIVPIARLVTNMERKSIVKNLNLDVQKTIEKMAYEDVKCNHPKVIT